VALEVDGWPRDSPLVARPVRQLSSSREMGTLANP
jgi:hypothetical protein